MIRSIELFIPQSIKRIQLSLLAKINFHNKEFPV